MKNVAIVGITGFGKAHLEMILSGCEKGYWSLLAATIINPEEVPEKVEELKNLGCAIYSDYRTMLEHHQGGIDLLFIPTAIHWHAPMAIDALHAGCNVLVEKPLAGSTCEAERIEEVSLETGKFVAVGFQHLYLPATWALKDAILNGQIGSLVRVKGLISAPRMLSYYQRNAWAGRLELDGRPVFDSPLNNAFAHFVNLLLFFAGSERTASARVDLEQGLLLRAQDIESFDTAAVRGKIESGVEFLFHATHSGVERFGPILEIEGATGSFTLDCAIGTLLHKDASGKATEVEPRGFSENGRPYMIENLKNLLEGRPADYCPTSIALNHCRLIEQLHQKFSIQNIPSAEIDRSNPEYVRVPGLAERLRRANQENSLD